MASATAVVRNAGAVESVPERAATTAEIWPCLVHLEVKVRFVISIFEVIIMAMVIFRRRVDVIIIINHDVNVINIMIVAIVVVKILMIMIITAIIIINVLK